MFTPSSTYGWVAFPYPVNPDAKKPELSTMTIGLCGTYEVWKLLLGTVTGLLVMSSVFAFETGATHDKARIRVTKPRTTDDAILNTPSPIFQQAQVAVEEFALF